MTKELFFKRVNENIRNDLSNSYSATIEVYCNIPGMHTQENCENDCPIYKACDKLQAENGFDTGKLNQFLKDNVLKNKLLQWNKLK